MKVQQTMKLLRHLAGLDHPKAEPLAKKIFNTLKTGKITEFDTDERKLFNVIRGGGFGQKLESVQQLTPDFAVRTGAYYYPGKGTKGGGFLSKSYFGAHKKLPITDIDFHDPLSHVGEQVVHPTLKDFAPALLSFMKTPGGQHSAFKIYRTPAGMRLMDVGKKWRGTQPYAYEGAMQDLGADAFYISGSVKSNRYNTRLFPKPGRKHNVWSEPGNITRDTRNFAKDNPGDFVAKQVKPNKVLMGSKAEVDPLSWKESLYHDRIIKNIVNRKKAKGIIKADNLLDLIR